MKTWMNAEEVAFIVTLAFFATLILGIAINELLWKIYARVGMELGTEEKKHD